MIKRFVSIAFGLCISLTVLCVPAKHYRRLLTLTDGSRVIATLYGDEHFHWFQTDNGQLLLPVEGSDLYEVSALSIEELKSVNGSEETTIAQRAPRRIGSKETAPLPCVGSPKIPVVLVNFTDSVFSVADTDEGVNAYYDLFCNGTRNGQHYQEHGSYGSIRDYFIDQSDSIFQPEFVVIGPVKLKHPISYYGENTYNSKGEVTTVDKRYNTFVKDAITAAVESYDIDWKVFDNKQKSTSTNTFVDMVFYIFAGCGEANGGVASTIWPKEDTSSKTINNITFSTSACCNERQGLFDNNGQVVGYKRDGIGIMCHELCHALGLPDFYDTSKNKKTAFGFGMDLWSIMDYGCYAGNSERPSGLTAYERDFLGWRELRTLSFPQELVLTPMESGGFGYKVVNDENPNEYYILENRQAIRWDGKLAKMGHGLQVTHVDYDATIWKNNQVNIDSIHQRMTIIAANNRYLGTTHTNDANEIKKTWAGNLYPFEGNDSLTTHSTPAATVYTSQGFMNKDIHRIREHDDLTVSLYFGNDFQTALNGVRTATPSSLPVFDLQGRRIANTHNPLRKGIYIVDKKKILLP